MKRIAICKACLNHEKDKDFGIICGLTYDKPKFSRSCPDFVHDPEIGVPTNFENKVSEYETYSTRTGRNTSDYKPGKKKNRIIGKKIMGFGLVAISTTIGLMSLTYLGNTDETFAGLGIFLGITGIILLAIGFIMFAAATNHYETEDELYEEQEIE
jgi:hypothetical protein